METVLLDVALCVNQQLKRILYRLKSKFESLILAQNEHWRQAWVYIVALVLHLLASLLCHLTAMNKITLIADERVLDSWSCSWMCMVNVALDTECEVMSAERPWLMKGAVRRTGWVERIVKQEHKMQETSQSKTVIWEYCMFICFCSISTSF